MSRVGVDALGRQYRPDIGQAGQIHGADDVVPVADARPAGLPGDEALSLPQDEPERDPVLLMINRVLGARLSTDNLAWRGDPVPVMRGLQKMLVAHSLTLAEDLREPAMEAIRAVELAVRWRLRWMQMRRGEAERHFTEPRQEEHATQKNA